MNIVNIMNIAERMGPFHAVMSPDVILRNELVYEACIQ